jgi:hypothetical protein
MRNAAVTRERNGKRLATTLAAAAMLTLAAGPACALDTDYPQDGENPLRMVYYFVAPVGELLEWTVARPLAIMGNVIAPYEHIDARGFSGCSRERPARSCTNVIK